MKHRIFLSALGMLLGEASAFACEICEAQQPKLLRGLTHGGGPQGSFDYVIVTITVVIVLFSLVYAIKCVWRPGEQEADHIKRILFNEDCHGS